MRLPKMFYLRAYVRAERLARRMQKDLDSKPRASHLAPEEELTDNSEAIRNSSGLTMASVG